MIYVTGDTHGVPARLSRDGMPFADEWGSKDYLIVCGDFGYLFAGTMREELFLRELSFRPYTILFVDGNHENFTMLEEYPVSQWKGGQVRRIRKNIYHLMRGQVYTIDGQRIFTMGGGYSLDKARRQEGRNWWERELPSEQEYQLALFNLEKAGMQVDYIITHAAPEQVMNLYHSDLEEEKELDEFLDWIRRNVKYKRWYFGHLHMDDELVGGLTAMFMSFRELTTGKVIG